jgi:hypothetical protein
MPYRPHIRVPHMRDKQLYLLAITLLIWGILVSRLIDSPPIVECNSMMKCIAKFPQKKYQINTCHPIPSGIECKDSDGNLIKSTKCTQHGDYTQCDFPYCRYKRDISRRLRKRCYKLV